MGTKNKPSRHDGSAKALPDEPQFTLLARDPQFAAMVHAWADQRERAVRCGDRSGSDMVLVQEARSIALEGEVWRSRNVGKWRKASTPL